MNYFDKLKIHLRTSYITSYRVSYMWHQIDWRNLFDFTIVVAERIKQDMIQT